MKKKKSRSGKEWYGLWSKSFVVGGGDRVEDGG